MKKFEYMTIIANPSLGNYDNEFNMLGEEGWELATAATDNSMDDDGDTYTECIWYTFKREIE